MSNISLFSKKPKLSTFSESIFRIEDNGAIYLGGNLLEGYRCYLRKVNRGVAFSLEHFDEDYNDGNDGKWFTLGGLYRSYLDVIITINNHEKYLEALKVRREELKEMYEEVEEKESHLAELEGYDEEYYDLVGNPIDIEDWESLVREIKYEINDLTDDIKIFEEDYDKLSTMMLSEWNCSGTL